MKKTRSIFAIVVIVLSRGGGGCEHIGRSALQLHIVMHQFVIVILVCELAAHVHAHLLLFVVISNRMIARAQADLGAAASPSS
ncbi:MAG: hypothetical protein ACKPKO_04205, partial [Candidatus Fonsibacter sp.]